MVILKFKHKGLFQLALKDDVRGIIPSHKKKIRIILNRLDSITIPDQMKQPGLNFHALKGVLDRHYSVKVSGNWRITFCMVGENVSDVDYIDYH